MIGFMDDIDSQQAHEQFPGDYRKCVKCGLEAFHDSAYKPMRVAWADYCYSDQIREEVALIRSKRDTALKGE
jgi:hypothetical protein